MNTRQVTITHNADDHPIVLFYDRDRVWHARVTQVVETNPALKRALYMQLIEAIVADLEGREGGFRPEDLDATGLDDAGEDGVNAA